MNKTIVTAIKGISIALMIAAIGLELWNAYALLTHHPMPKIPQLVFWFERFAVITHLLEGVVAAIYVSIKQTSAQQTSRKQTSGKQTSAIAWGIYTFFVGTVGLVELFSPSVIANDTRAEPRESGV